MSIRRLSATFVITSLLLLISFDSQRRALATDGAIGSGGTDSDSIWAGVQTSSPPTGSGADSSGYTWKPATIYDSRIGATTGITKLVGTVRYDLYERHSTSGMVLIWITRATGSELAQNAAVIVKGRLPQPTVTTAPATNRGVVNVGMWLWANADWWYGVTAMAWIPTVFGSAWARTTATPVSLSFVTQDDADVNGTTVGSTQCTGPGSVWTVNAGDTAVSGCMYTYRHSSAQRDQGVFVAIVSVTWKISWTSNAASGGSLPSYTTSTFMAFTVDELQALVGSGVLV